MCVGGGSQIRLTLSHNNPSRSEKKNNPEVKSLAVLVSDFEASKSIDIEPVC